MIDGNIVDSDSVSTQGNGSKPRILLADDSKLIRVTAEKVLSAKFDVVFAEDGEQAWEMLCNDDTIQVVFTDLGMPKLDGYGLINRIRHCEQEAIRNQPIIVITGAAEGEDVKRKVFEIGATDFITKPFKSTEIIARAEAHANYRRDKDTLQKSVDIDLLTGALNQNGLQTQLERDVSFVNRHRENLALVMFELDGFEGVAERVGKSASEQIIKQTALVLSKTIRKEDSLGRLDFAKFVAVLPMAKTEGVVNLARRLGERIKGFKITIGGDSLSLSMSIGIASIRKGASTQANDLLGAAQQALDNAKSLGSGEVQLIKVESSTKREAPPDLNLEALLEAIAENQLDSVRDRLDLAVDRLKPLVALLSDEQKRRLME